VHKDLFKKIFSSKKKQQQNEVYRNTFV